VLTMQSHANEYRMYMEVDGEYFYCLNPQLVRVERSSLSDRFSILVPNESNY